MKQTKEEIEAQIIALLQRDPNPANVSTPKQS